MSPRTKGVDHILLGAANLDAAIDEFERLTGIEAVRGGRHPNAGTENALVSLGENTYLELIAPQPGTTSQNPLVDELKALDRLTLVGWAAHVTDVATARSRMQAAGFTVSDAKPGSRVKPDGDTLSWVTFDVERPAFDTAPFFIRWGDGVVHPSRSSPAGCSLRAFEVSDSKAKALGLLLEAAGVDVGVKQAEHAALSVTLRCGEREHTFLSK